MKPSQKPVRPEPFDKLRMNFGRSSFDSVALRSGRTDERPESKGEHPIDACFDDFRIGAVKLGMLANKQVIDPVMVATSGARLLEP